MLLVVFKQALENATRENESENYILILIILQPVLLQQDRIIAAVFSVFGTDIATYIDHWPVGVFGATCIERSTCPYLLISCSWRLAETPHFFVSWPFLYFCAKSRASCNDHLFDVFALKLQPDHLQKLSTSRRCYRSMILARLTFLMQWVY